MDMISEMNFTHDNVELELTFADLGYWQELEKNDNSDKELNRLMRSFVFSVHGFLSENYPKAQYLISCHFSRMSEIKDLNTTYRGIEKDTDVLSFPLHENFEGIAPGIPVHLGDIYISLDKASQQAKEFNIDLLSELVHLMIHGFLHLLGFDHEISNEDERKMIALEQKLITKVKHIYPNV